MSVNDDNPTLVDFEQALPFLRAELHRYCARMSGSVIDGEDILQEALIKATEALQRGDAVDNLRAWLFRIAHNVAVNWFRAQSYRHNMKQQLSHQEAETQAMPAVKEVEHGLRLFMHLPIKQRSAVVLRDILGYTAEEVAELTDSSLSAIKSALNRGREQLKILRESVNPKLTLSQQQDALVVDYAQHFNAHNFNALRDMLADEVKLELVSRFSAQGKPTVSNYFGNYQKVDDWLVRTGFVEERPALLVFDKSNKDSTPVYFILLTFDQGELIAIRDFRYARYIMNDASWRVVD